MKHVMSVMLICGQPSNAGPIEHHCWSATRTRYRRVQQHARMHVHSPG